MNKHKLQLFKFCLYGFLKNLRFFDAFLILFFKESGLSYFQIGWLYSMREATAFLLEIPTGIAADIFGKKRSMLVSLFSYTISFIIFYYYANFYAFILAMALYATGEAFRTGTHKAIILDYLEHNRIEDQKIKYYSYVRTWAQIGLAASTLMAGVLIFKFNRYNIIFMAAIFPYLINLINIISYDVPRIHKSSENQMAAINERFIGLKNTIIRTFKIKSFRNIIYNSTIYDGSFKAIKDYIQPLLSTYALSLPLLLPQIKSEAIVVTITYVGLYILSAISSKSSCNITQKVKSLPFFINMVLVLTVGLYMVCGLTITLNILPVTIISFVGLYILFNIRRPVMICYLTDNIPREISATTLSIESQARSILTAIIAPAIGLGADKLGLGITFIIFSLCLVLISFKLLITKKSFQNRI